MDPLKKQKQLSKRKLRLRKKIVGASDRPRLALNRSHLNLYVQVIDDINGKTVLSMSTSNPKMRAQSKNWGNVAGSKKFGEIFGEELKSKQINKIVFDRRGRPYHGRVKAFADALREKGIQF